jgi:hypothetical protein
LHFAKFTPANRQIVGNAVTRSVRASHLVAESLGRTIDSAVVKPNGARNNLDAVVERADKALRLFDLLCNPYGVEPPKAGMTGGAVPDLTAFRRRPFDDRAPRCQFPESSGRFCTKK